MFVGANNFCKVFSVRTLSGVPRGKPRKIELSTAPAAPGPAVAAWHCARLGPASPNLATEEQVWRCLQTNIFDSSPSVPKLATAEALQALGNHILHKKSGPTDPGGPCVRSLCISGSTLGLVFAASPSFKQMRAVFADPQCKLHCLQTQGMQSV